MTLQEQNEALTETISRQSKEIEQLKMHLGQEQFAEELHKLLTSSTLVGLVLSPFSLSHLLEMIVQTATRFLNVRASSLFLIDEAAQDLVFEVAIGPAAAEVKHFRVPLGHGIAGLVALTGQPMAIANAQHDARMATDIAFAVNYIPATILCVPLFYDERIIGVLELLDRQDGDPFDPADIEISGQFANIAAIAIAQSSAFLDQQAFFQAMMRSFGEMDAGYRQSLYHQTAVFTRWANTTDTLSSKARELALCLHELILDGEEQNCDLCLKMFQGILAGVRERKKLLDTLSVARLPLASAW
jgi:transcriptional regulator with GAF, ATPase, and Fis domain